jgi:large subunit ribosomal protein L17
VLFTDIAPRYTERNGGYTRVVRSRKRDGDKAQMAVIQFVEKEFTPKSKAEPKKRRVVAPVVSPAVEVVAAENSAE